MKTALVMTDAGEAYVKALGNPQGPHPIACEWVATHLARWFGLPTFETAILVLDSCDEIPFPHGSARPGPAFAARKMEGRPWSGSREDLLHVANPEAVSRLVVFDNWVLNCDRHREGRAPNKDNVFLADGQGSGSKTLIAMDHTHCFTCGADLSRRMGEIDQERDDRVYGLFPEFVPMLRADTLEECRQQLLRYERPVARSIIEEVPREWEVPGSAVEPWADLVYRRSRFVADAIVEKLAAHCPQTPTQGRES